MIFYFTGTGNSRWVAEQLAEVMNEVTVDMASCLLRGTVPAIEGRVGIVFPIHSWMVPWPVLYFLSKLSVPKDVYRYAVCTCGDDAGKAMTFLSNVFSINAAWSVIMPNTYVPMFSLDSDRVAFSKILAARKQIAEISRVVMSESCKWEVHEGSFPWFKSYIINFLFTRFAIRISKFHIDKGCISCGYCMKVCPMDNICLIDGRPHWGTKCINCMACLHGCPVEVIQYGKSTRKKGRYRLQRYL